MIIAIASGKGGTGKTLVATNLAAALGASVIIAGGMGQRAQTLFVENGIQVVVGAEAVPVEDLVRQHLAGTLKTGQNVCDH